MPALHTVFRDAAIRLLAAICASAPAAPALAQWRFFDSEFDEERVAWKEIEAKLPPAPKPAGLLRFEGGAATPHQYLIDPASLSIGEDGVVRYTLVVRTGGGATNISFEGMRCETREQKTYAFGRGDGSWSRARDPRWRFIARNEMSRHHGTLFEDYLCVNVQLPRSTQEILNRLRHPVSRD